MKKKMGSLPPYCLHNFRAFIHSFIHSNSGNFIFIPTHLYSYEMKIVLWSDSETINGYKNVHKSRDTCVPGFLFKIH